jgi:SAM-dependent methyltransferase
MNSAVTFRCPACRAGIGLRTLRSVSACPSCGVQIATDDGIVDFVAATPVVKSGDERAYYDGVYAGYVPANSVELQLATLGPRWHGPEAPPERQAAWRRLGDLSRKTVLLLGNGDSYPELYLLTARPAVLIYSDLSPAGLRNIRDGYTLQGYEEHLLFAAIEACDLPMFDGTVDVICGFAFAHHIADLDAFLAETARVLRPGGRAVFVDNAYSPLWQRLKLGVLQPLMRISHEREPRSPEDVRETLAGGFREDDLARRITAVGGRPWFERQALLQYMWHRASVSLFPEELGRLHRRAGITSTLTHIDERLARFAPVRRHFIRLIWGFDKP